MQEGKDSKKNLGSARRAAPIHHLLCDNSMSKAIGFGVLVIVLAVLLPAVLQALETLLLTVLGFANEAVIGLASSSHMLVR
jgi:Flp pilus assembly pilin Flp